MHTKATHTERKRRNKHLRARIRHAALTRIPMWLSRGKLSRSRSVLNVHVTQRTIPLSGLPAPLDGLKIAHLSDLHVGLVLRPDTLPAIVEATNRLGADMIAVTGDFVDLSLNVLEPVVDALANLKAPLGTYLCMGNHDHLEDGRRVIRRLRDANLNLLVNESHSVRHEGCEIVIAGIDYAHHPHELRRLVDETMAGVPTAHDTTLRLLLAHHPHAFDHTRQHNISLTLSGHTHGGQVLLSNRRGRKGSIGPASLGFKYPRGLYRRQSHYLYVTSGVGMWFPLRVRCPAEIACLTLHHTAAHPQAHSSAGRN